MRETVGDIGQKHHRVQMRLDGQSRSSITLQPLIVVVSQSAFEMQ